MITDKETHNRVVKSGNEKIHYTCICGKCIHKEISINEMITYFKKQGDLDIVELLKKKKDERYL